MRNSSMLFGWLLFPSFYSLQPGFSVTMLITFELFRFVECSVFIHCRACLVCFWIERFVSGHRIYTIKARISIGLWDPERWSFWFLRVLSSVCVCVILVFCRTFLLCVCVCVCFGLLFSFRHLCMCLWFSEVLVWHVWICSKSLWNWFVVCCRWYLVWWFLCFF